METTRFSNNLAQRNFEKIGKKNEINFKKELWDNRREEGNLGVSNGINIEAYVRFNKINDILVFGFFCVV